MIGPFDIRKKALEAFGDATAKPSHVAAFAAWVTRGRMVAMDRTIVNALSAEAVARHPEHCAALGFAIHAGDAEQKAVGLFVNDIKQLSGRRFFEAGRPPAFEVDGIALMGVALGIAAINGEGGDVRWFSELLVQAESHLTREPWSQSLVRAAQFIVGDRNDMATVNPTLAVIVASRLGKPVSSEELDSAWSETVAEIDHFDGPARDSVHVALINLALARLASAPVGRMTIEDLSQVLMSLERSMRLWTWEVKSRTAKSLPRQWHVDHEYHVQNLLWAILAPLFADLEDELYLPKIGQKTPRADIGIPRLRTIVEVKFIRRKGPSAFRQVIGEIAEDASLYRTEHSNYDQIIAFIWDNHAQTEEHAEAVAGLKKLPGVIDAIISSRPAKMQNDDPTSVAS